MTIKLKTVNFEVKTRASSVKTPIGTAEEIFTVARELLKTEMRACHPQPLRLRLMGENISGNLSQYQYTLSKDFTKKHAGGRCILFCNYYRPVY